MQTTIMEATRGGGDATGMELCLLSLDGGGVRGISSLLILRKLMETLDPDDPPKPCDYFDMICGTSTGGLIAIMLGRLRMSVEECILEYKRLCPGIFSKLHHRVTVKGEIRGRFDHEALEKGVKDLLKRKGLIEDELFKENSKAAACRTFVCATSRVTSETVILSNYYSERRGNDIRNIAKIWEVARATSAASSFFDPIDIGTEGFVDGATGANNPVHDLWTEAQDAWSDGPGWKLEENLKCLISIGTGKLLLKAFGSSIMKNEIGKALVSITTNTERVADMFQKQNTQLFQDQRAFRFNVDRGLEEIGLEEADKVPAIEGATRAYIQTERAYLQFRSASAKLKERQWLRALLESVRSESILSNGAIKKELKNQILPQWLLHTSSYERWYNRGGVLWCKEEACIEDNPLTSTNIALCLALSYQFSMNEKTSILGFQCVKAPGTATHEKKTAASWSSGSKLHSAVEIFKSLVLQALAVDDDISPPLAKWTSELGFYDQIILRKVMSASKWVDPRLLVEGLRLSLAYRKSQYVIALDHAERIDNAQLQQIINPLRKLAETGSIRLLLSGTSTNTILATLDGVDSIDKNTEYQECLLTMQSKCTTTGLELVATPDPGTADWLWKNERFLRWDRSSAGILWIEGKPGSGKSVLAKSILSRLASNTHQKHSWLVSHWFYTTRGEKAQRLHESLLMAILCQLLEQERRLFKHFESYYRKDKPCSRLWSTTANLIGILKDIADDGTSIHCIIDAVDESQDDCDDGISRVNILFELSRLVSGVQNSRVKLVILSRPLLAMDTVFIPYQSQFGNVHHILLQAENEETIRKVTDNGLNCLQQEMRRFDLDKEAVALPSVARRRRPIRNRTGKAKATRPKDVESSTIQNIRRYILDNAQGVVLWVKLIIQVLESHIQKGLWTFPELEDKLKGLPTGTIELYSHIVRSLEAKFGEEGLEKTRKALMWVSGANLVRPLTLEELCEALAIPNDYERALESSEDPIQQQMASWRSYSSFARQLRERCGPFVDVIRRKSSRKKGFNEEDEPPDSPREADSTANRPDDVVQLLHRTAKDFFATSGEAGLLKFNDDEALGLVHGDIGKYLRISFPRQKVAYSPLSADKNEPWIDKLLDVVEYIDCRRLLPFALAILHDNISYKKELLNIYASLDNLVYPKMDNETADEFIQSNKDEFGRFLPSRLHYGQLHKARSIIAGEYTYHACTNGFQIAMQFLNELLQLSLEWREIPGEAIIHAYCLVAVENNYDTFVLEAPSIFFPTVYGRRLRALDTEYDEERRAMRLLIRSDYPSLKNIESKSHKYWISSLEAAAIQNGHIQLTSLLYCMRYSTPLRGKSPYKGRGKSMFDYRIKRRTRSVEPSPPRRSSSREYSATRGSAHDYADLNLSNPKPRAREPKIQQQCSVYGAPSRLDVIYDEDLHLHMRNAAKEKRKYSEHDETSSLETYKALTTVREVCVEWWRHWGYNVASPHVVTFEPSVGDLMELREAEERMNQFCFMLSTERLSGIFPRPMSDGPL